MGKLFYITSTILLIIAVSKNVKGSTSGIPAGDKILSPLARIQNVLSASYHESQSMTGFPSSKNKIGPNQSILSNIEDTLLIPGLRFDFDFKLEYDYVASWLTNHTFGRIEIRQGMFSGLSQIKDEFSVKFLNAEGDFQALLSIQIPSLLFMGNYETNITNHPFKYPTPDQNFSGGGIYNSSFNSVEFGLKVDGHANQNDPISIQSVQVSFDFSNPTSTFSNLFLKSWTTFGWGIATWLRTIPTFSDIPKYFSWSLGEFSVFLDFQSVSDEVFKCVLQSAFNNCSLMDLLVSTDCINKMMDTDCMQTEIFELNFLDETSPDTARGRLYQHSTGKIHTSKNSIGTGDGNFVVHGSSDGDNLHGLVENLALTFLETIRSEHGLCNQVSPELRANSSKPRNRFSRGTGTEESPVEIPSVDVALRWRYTRGSAWIGGSFKAWDSKVIGFNGGQETISAEFLDPQGTFVVTYNVTFPFLNVSGKYDTDITIYQEDVGTAGGWYNLGEGQLRGTGEYHWNLTGPKVGIILRGRAPMDGKMSLYDGTFEMAHDELGDIWKGARFTNLTDKVISYFGNTSVERYPENWTQLYPSHLLLIHNFLYNDIYYQRNKTFEDFVAEQMMCALNFAIQDCSILDLVVSDDCLRLERDQSCFDGPEMTVRQPTTWSTPIPTENPHTTIIPTMEPSQSSTVTIGPSTEQITSTTEVSTPEPENPINMRLLLNQTQLLLSQAKLLLNIIQTSV